MNRRLFLTTLTGCLTLEETSSAAGPKVVLEALAAERMPLWAVLKTDQDLNGLDLFELRHYSRPVPGQLEIFRTAGIRIVFAHSGSSGMTCLLAFPALAIREQAWNTVNSASQWPGAAVTHLTLFRRAQT